MTEHVLVTVEITISDLDRPGRYLALGGPPEQADAMAAALAQHLNVTPAPDGALLEVELCAAELRPILLWVQENYPQIGVAPLSEKPLPKKPLGGAISPWRDFQLAVADDVPFDEELRADVVAIVDILHERQHAWHLDPARPIGAVVRNHDPMLQVRVVPGEQMVYVDFLPPDTELPEPSPSPYTGRTHH
jgi:hypothetical protein